jgi:hypothetical protein
MHDGGSLSQPQVGYMVVAREFKSGKRFLLYRHEEHQEALTVCQEFQEILDAVYAAAGNDFAYLWQVSLVRVARVQ